MQNLKNYHTFQIDVYSQEIITINTQEELKDWLEKTQASNTSRLLIGKGSDILFTEDFQGSIAINQIKGIELTEDQNHYYLHAGAGEDWHEFIKWTVSNNIGGLENLALIPGSVGASPIQNIGAYGVELKDVCYYVETLNTDLLIRKRFKVQDCEFGYRESIFKHRYKDNFIVTAVGFKLPKHWQPTLIYGELKNLDPSTQTPLSVFNKICEIRQTKLPDPKVTGNAGSFFKNPLVSQALFAEILAQHPNMPHYPQSNGEIKLPAGWLIDQCGLKGKQIGGAMVHPNQALVLINANHATSQDVVTLAKTVQAEVKQKFKVELEPEVRFYGSHGEINFKDL